MPRMRGDYDREATAEEKAQVVRFLKGKRQRFYISRLRAKGWTFHFLGIKRYAFGRLPVFMARSRRTGRKVYGNVPEEISNEITYRIYNQGEDA